MGAVYKNTLKINENILRNTKIDTLRINYCFVKIVRALHCFLDLLQNLKYSFICTVLNAIEVTHFKVRNVWYKLYNYCFVACLQSFTQRKFMN